MSHWTRCVVALCVSLMCELAQLEPAPSSSSHCDTYGHDADAGRLMDTWYVEPLLGRCARSLAP